MDDTSTPDVQIVADRVNESANVPQTSVVEFSDQDLEENFDRRLRRAICSPSEMDNAFVSHVKIYESDLCRSSINSTPKDNGGCKISRDPKDTKSGTNVSKADAGLGEELSLLESDNGECLQKIGLPMHGKAQQFIRSQADEFSYTDNFSRYFADIREQTLPSASCRGAQFSSVCSQPQRKSSRLLSKRRRTCLDWDLLDWEFEKVEDVIFLDDEDLCGETMDGSSDEWKEIRLYYPSRNDPEVVALSWLDMECLNPEQFLSSPIMNFYIQYLKKTEPTTCRLQVGYHIFNTFFFGKLEEALSQKSDRSQCFLRLRRWWKGVNIFSKAYILLPIHGSSHWSLVIICNPGMEYDSSILILHLDSLGLHSTQQISRIVSDFLKEEWNYMNQNPSADLPFRGHVHLPFRIEKKKVMVPQQKNEYDCGIFVLYFIKRFLEEAPQRLGKHDLSMFHSTWFKPEEASNLRDRIRYLLLEEFNKSMSREVGSSVCSDAWDIS